MRNLGAHFRKHVTRGLVALIPIVLALFVIDFLYDFVDQRMSSPISSLLGFRIPGLGLLILELGAYLVGVAASNLVGRMLLRLIEKSASRIPLVGRAYGVGKQLAETLSLPEKNVFRRAVLVEFLYPGTWTVGFVTGALTDLRHPEVKYLRVYVPTPPNPLSGTLLIVPESAIRDPGWEVEDALRAVISGGLIGPGSIN